MCVPVCSKHSATFFWARPRIGAVSGWMRVDKTLAQFLEEITVQHGDSWAHRQRCAGWGWNELATTS